MMACVALYSAVRRFAEDIELRYVLPQSEYHTRISIALQISYI